MQSENIESAYVSLVIRLVVLLIWSFHFYKAYNLYLEYRDRRAMRNLSVAAMIMFAMLALVGSSMTRVGWLPVEVALFFGYLSFGALLVTGLFVDFTWIQDGQKDRTKTEK